MAEDEEFEQQAERQGREQRQDERSQKVADDPVKRHGEVGPEHVLDAVGEIDEIHDAENQRQAGRDQEQKDAELQSVEDLDEEERA